MSVDITPVDRARIISALESLTELSVELANADLNDDLAYLASTLGPILDHEFPEEPFSTIVLRSLLPENDQLR